MDVSSFTVPINLLKPVGPSPTVTASATGAMTPATATAARAHIASTAKSFETQFLSVMLGQMFEGVETPAPFGGGEAESTFKSFLTDAFARSLSDRGGIGLTKTVSKEMLKMQGLS